MQNGGICAKFEVIPLQPSSILGENVGKFYSTWNPGNKNLDLFYEIENTALPNSKTAVLKLKPNYANGSINFTDQLKSFYMIVKGANMPATDSFITMQPSIYLGNVKDPLLTNQLVNFTILLTKEGAAICSAEFNNWGQKDGTPGFLFFSDPRLNSGESFQIKVGDQVLFSGLIQGSSARFPEGSPPSFGLSAVTKTRKKTTTPQPAPAVYYGATLSEFAVKEEWEAGKIPTQPVCWYRGQGTMELTSEIKPGLQVDLHGIGEKYSGVFVLSEVKHMFDMTKGLRTCFSAERLGT